MQLEKEMRFLGIGVIAVFMLVAGVAIYWSVLVAPMLNARADNPRQVDRLANIQRGQIVDRDGVLLAYSESDGQRQTRVYPLTSTYSALGYYSLRYGSGRAEAAYDDLLTGAEQAEDDLGSYFERELLHQAVVGTDVQLTLIAELQTHLADTLAGHTGAGVLLSVPEGEVHAMVSLPAYNPNELDARWDEFVEMEGDLFFNRVIQGVYQPGHLLQIPLIVGAMVDRFDLEEPIPNAQPQITLDDLALTCTTSPDADTLNLSDAFIFGCPGVFAALISTQDVGVVEAWLDMFALQERPLLAGFEALPEETLTDETLRSQSTLLEDALGQGDIQVSPLQMASMIGAAINRGNAPEPHLLRSIRPPEAETWQPVPVVTTSLPIMTETTAQALQTMLRDSVLLIDPTLEGQRIGGKTALAFSGEETQTWFVGYVRTGQDRGFAIAIVLEDTDDPAVVAEIGINVLREAGSAVAG